MLTSSRSFTKHKAVSQLTVGRRNTTETKTLRLKLSPRALAHVEELSRLLLGDDDDEPETTDGVLIKGRQADDAPQPNGKGNGSDGSAGGTENGEAVIYAVLNCAQRGGAFPASSAPLGLTGMRGHPGTA